MRIAEGMDPTGPTGVASQDLTSEEYRTRLTDLIRSGGFAVLDDVNGRRSGVKDLDPIVYAGVVDRFDTDKYFMWSDLHWQLTKVTLFQRTKEWNEALEKYCDEMGFTRAEREAVVQKHMANPCAPCSNPLLQQLGDKAKGIQSLLPMQMPCLLFSRLPKERLEGTAQVHMRCNLKYVNSMSPLISFQTGFALS
jgi:hypothetical protein